MKTGVAIRNTLRERMKSDLIDQRGRNMSKNEPKAE